MERFDIGRDDRLADMVDAFERGEEVEIVRDGAVIAHRVAPTPPSPRQRRTPQFDRRKGFIDRRRRSVA